RKIAIGSLYPVTSESTTIPSSCSMSSSNATLIGSDIVMFPFENSRHQHSGVPTSKKIQPCFRAKRANSSIHSNDGKSYVLLHRSTAPTSFLGSLHALSNLLDPFDSSVEYSKP